MSIRHGEGVTDLEAKSLPDLVRLGSSSAPSCPEQRVGKVDSDDLMSEACERDGLIALPTAGIEHPERPIQRREVGTELTAHKLLSHGVAHHAKA
jgi:hypothetical protein